MIKVLLFAQLAELANTNVCEIAWCSGMVVRDVITAITDDIASDVLIEKLADESAMVSINQQFATWDSPLTDGDEVGLLPSVSGG
jgi:molybdopterin converting factor small subunit